MARYSYKRFRGGFSRGYNNFRGRFQGTRRRFTSYPKRKKSLVWWLTAALIIVGALAIFKPTWLKTAMSKLGLKTAQ